MSRVLPSHGEFELDIRISKNHSILVDVCKGSVCMNINLQGLLFIIIHFHFASLILM